MDAWFNDFQDQSSRLHRAMVSNKAQVCALLDEARSRKAFGCELVGENGYQLTLGIGKDVGFVQYGPSSGALRYLMALAPGKQVEQEHMDFLIGDTATEIPRRFSVPLALVKKIAVYFVEMGERSLAVSWEEV